MTSQSWSVLTKRLQLTIVIDYSNGTIATIVSRTMPLKLQIDTLIIICRSICSMLCANSRRLFCRLFTFTSKALSMQIAFVVPKPCVCEWWAQVVNRRRFCLLAKSQLTLPIKWTERSNSADRTDRIVCRRRTTSDLKRIQSDPMICDLQRPTE